MMIRRSESDWPGFKPELIAGIRRRPPGPGVGDSGSEREIGLGPARGAGTPSRRLRAGPSRRLGERLGLDHDEAAALETAGLRHPSLL